jgi:hypothetical protein
MLPIRHNAGQGRRTELGLLFTLATILLAAWTVSAGPAPLRTHILTARALGMGAGTKRELAVAAYLRDEANQFTLSKVAEALRAVLGGEFNVQRNVVNGLQAGGLVKINKVTAEDGTSYRLELTAKGEARVNKWLAEHGHAGASTDGHVAHDADRLASTRARRAAAARDVCKSSLYPV